MPLCVYAYASETRSSHTTLSFAVLFFQNNPSCEEALFGLSNDSFYSLSLSASSVCCSLSTNLNNVYNNYGCVCGGQDDERKRMMSDVTNKKKKTIEISAPDFFAHAES